MKLSEARGKLIAIGGAEERDSGGEILKKFLTMAGGPKARVVVLAYATKNEPGAGDDYVGLFRRLGVDEAHKVDVSSREDAAAEPALKKLEKATGIFFIGGDQLDITSLFGGTEMQRLINERYERGAVLAGTSAGASAFGNSMIVRGEAEECPRLHGIEIAPGLDMIVGVIIDSHFSQRGRHGRLLTAVAHYPQDLGIGIDENTAMVVERDEFEVIGEGAVTVFDGGAMTFTNVPDATREEPNLALYGVRVHVLPAGSRFNLTERAPLPPRQSKKTRNSDSDGREKNAGKAEAAKGAAKKTAARQAGRKRAAKRQAASRG